MVIVAVAGGTGPGLGRSIITALAKNPNHKVLVLSRATSRTPEWINDLDVEVRKVDYTFEESLKEALVGVHTVISTLLAQDGTWESTQIRLMNAGLANGITRFAPADWGLGALSTPLIEMLAPQEQIWAECRKAAAAREGKFEWSAFRVGLFMNYLGLGAPDKEALCGLTDTYKFVWDVENMKAEIPLNKEGGVPRITMTEIGDIGRFVSKACDLPFGSWVESMGMQGDTKGMGEIVEIVERARGRKMEVMYKPFEVLQRERMTAVEPVKKFWLELEEAYARDRYGEGVFPTELNDTLKGEVVPLSIEEYVTKYWSGT